MPIDQTMKILSKMLDVSSFRQQVHAGNLANMDTPEYKAKEVLFEDQFNQTLSTLGVDAALEVEPAVSDTLGLAMQNDGNNVSSEREVMAMAQNKTLYDTYIQMMRGKNKMIDIASGAAP